MVRIRAGRLIFLAAFVVSALVQGLAAQQWPETFTTQGQLPAGWEHTTSNGTGVTQWNVDANGSYRPSAPLQGTFDPFRTGSFSLNWNDGVKAYPDQTSGPLERGVATPVIDVTFAPNPELSFWTLWDRWNTTSDYHIMRVRVWNSNYTIMHYSETMPTAGGLTPWHNRVIPLNRNWGQIRVEFYYKCGPLANTEKNAAGWFIDDVDFTGLTPPTFGIVQQNNLGSGFSTGTNLSVQLTTDYGTLPAQGWQVISGSLPQGVTINGSGLISGTPAQAGIFNFMIEVQDSATPPLTATKSFTMTVNRGPGFIYPVKTLPFEDTFSSDEGWVYASGMTTPYSPSPGPYADNSTGGWERGPTSASAPASPHDNGDPASDATPASQDNMVMGVVAGGPIPTNIPLGSWYWAYSPEITVAGVREVNVFFQRWMNCYNTSVHQCRAEIWNPVSQTWANVWTMASGQENSQAWTTFNGSMDFGAPPVSGATTRLRFGYMVTHSSALTTFRGGGFTVDEVSIIQKPVSGILRVLDFTVVSPHPPVGQYPRMYVGNSYPMLVLLENTSNVSIALFNYAELQESISGPPPYTPENVGHMVPTQSAPWIIPPGIHYLTYDPASPPGGAGPEIAHFDFRATAVPSTGSGGTVIYNLQFFGQETGGNQRTVVADTATGPAGAELIHVMTPPPLQITDPWNLPDATVDVPYAYALTAQGGTPPYHSWQIQSGPPWMFMVNNELRFTASLNDVPNPPQTFQITISVEDSAGLPNTAIEFFQVTVIPVAPPLAILTPSQLPNAREGVAYLPLPLNHIGGQAPYTWSNFVWLGPPTGNGTLAGMTFDLGLGQLSGTPAPGTQGSYAFNVTLSDSSTPAPQSVTRTFFINVVPANNNVAITTPTQFNASGAPPIGLETAPYNGGTAFRFEATGGYAGPPGNEYQWIVIQGQLPPGLVLDANSGELSGIALVPGTYVFELRASDGALPPNSGTAVFTIHVDSLVQSPLQFATVSTLPQGHEGNPYQHTLEGRNGTTPYTWSLKAGSTLPTGLSINPQTGQIGGMIFSGQAAPPSEDFTFTVVLEDSALLPATAEKAFTLNVVAFKAGALAIVTAHDLPQGGVLSPYSTAIRATGGNPANPVAPYTFALDVGSALPRGLVLDGNGTLYGTPSESGVFNFIIECYDGITGLATREFEMQVNGFPGGTDPDVEIQPGAHKSELIPLWEACSLAGGGGGIAILLASWIAVLAARRRKATA